MSQATDVQERGGGREKELSEVVEDKQFEWKFAVAWQDSMPRLDAGSGTKLLKHLLADEAFDTVGDNLNGLFPGLEMAAEQLRGAKDLSFAPGIALDLASIQIHSIQKARR